jgi:hypothetical protein
MKSPGNDASKKSVLSVTSATTKIKELIVKAVATKQSNDALQKELAGIIAECCSSIKDQNIKTQTRKCLVASARKWIYELRTTAKTLEVNMIAKLKPILNDKAYTVDFMSLLFGTPSQAYDKFRPYLDAGNQTIVPIIKDYRKIYQSVLKGISAEPSKVINYTTASGKKISYTMSLRNRAEIEARFQACINDLQQWVDIDKDKAGKYDLKSLKLKPGAPKLVWTSSHPNCSPRCEPYQGKLWSLDGTKGVKNGIPYRPITEALLGPKNDGNGIISGYNCRHRLVPYEDNSHPPDDYSDGEIKKAYTIDKRQREYENNIRQMKVQEKILRANGNIEEAQAMRKKWRKATKDYEIYSLNNDRAYYRWRTVVDKDELKDIDSTVELKPSNDSIQEIKIPDVVQEHKYIVDDLHPETIAGIKRAEEMSFEEADGGRVNPNYGTSGGYSINCQSCVVTYEARLRGYNVEVLPNTRGSKLEQLSYDTDAAWIDPATGKKAKGLSCNTKTPSELLSLLKTNVVEGGRYNFSFAWKGTRSGHIITMERRNGEFRLYDPQINKLITRDDELLAYFSRIKINPKTSMTIYGHTIPYDEDQLYRERPELLRVDTLQFNSDYSDNIMKGAKPSGA